jgi:hypothetical protein
MVGLSTFFISFSVFLAFLVLPQLADSQSDYDLDSSGTDFALLIVVVVCLVSSLASYLVWAGMKFENGKKIDNQSESARVASTVSAFGRAVIPRDGDSMLKAVLSLPPAFYLAILGNKSVNYFFNTFSLFSTPIYEEEFGLSASQASLATGLASLLAGVLAPFMGLYMDKFGRRSIVLVVACGMLLIGFLVLGIFKSSTAVWVVTVLFAINNSFSDLAIVTIPIIVGPSRAGVAYGLYGILGNTFDAMTSLLAGVIMESGDNGAEIFIWFSTAIAFLGTLAWVGVYVLESRMSFIETPLDQIVETRMEHFHFATLCAIAEESPELEEDRASGDVDVVLEETQPKETSKIHSIGIEISRKR